jgi:hypothetical protein
MDPFSWFPDQLAELIVNLKAFTKRFDKIRTGHETRKGRPLASIFKAIRLSVIG